jgi:transcriptional regulator with XRE-family HTH domain
MADEAVIIRFPQEIGQLIGTARRHAGWSRQRLAQALYCDVSTLGRIEQGVLAADWPTVLRAACLLRYPPLLRRAVTLVEATVRAPEPVQATIASWRG